MKNWLIVIYLILVNLAYSQNEANIWYFGDRAGLDFNSGSPIPLLDGVIQTGEGCASIADSNGDLLFYTDGITIWNKNHEVMVNGDGLLGSSDSTQSGIIVPKPNDPNIYYVFTVDNWDADAEEEGLNYNVVDLTLQGGLGEVIEKNVNLIKPTTEKLTAVLHANGRDIWVMTYVKEQDAVLAYLITPSGVNTTPVTSSVSSDLAVLTSRSSFIGYMKSSPNGQLLAIASVTGNLGLYKLNAFTGQITNELLLNHYTGFPYGVEFSPDSKLLYLSEDDYNVNESHLFQYDLTNYTQAAILASEFLVHASPVEGISGLQLGPDGKLYAASLARPLLSVVNNPNEMGSACDYEDQAIDLGGRQALGGLPTFIQSYFNVRFESENLCEGDATAFTLTGSDIVSATWNFGDPSSGADNTSTDLNPTHIFTTAGTFTVSVTATNSAGDSDSFEQEVEIFPNPTPNSGATFTVCSGSDTATFPLTDVNTTVSNDIPNESIRYFQTEALAETNNDTDTLVSPHSMMDGMLYARVENNTTLCSTIVPVNVDVNFPIPVSQNAQLRECEDEDGNVSFTLTNANAQVTSESAVTITYHETENDADSGTDAITTWNQPATVFARVLNTIGCYSIAEVELTKDTLTVLNSLTKTFCSTTTDTLLNLSTFQPEIATGTDLDFSFYNSRTDAENENNVLPTSTDIATETIHVRVDNGLGCTSFTAIDFTVNTFPTVGNNFSEEICFTENNASQATLTLSDYNTNFNTDANQSIAYYANQTDLENENNAINASQEQIITSDTTFLVRVNNADNTCFRQRTLSITIADDWQITNQTDSRCVNTGEDAQFNLETWANAIVVNPSDYTFAFYQNETDASQQNNAITDFQDYETSQSETITVTMTNQAGCILYGDIDLSVNENPVLQSVSPTACSEGTEGEFDLNAIRQELDPASQYDIDFYASQTDLDNNNPISSNAYSSANTTLLAVARNQTTGCETTASLPLTVNLFPTATPVNETFCELELPIIVSLDDLRIQVNATEQVDIFASGESIPLSSDFTLTESSTFTARVSSTAGCEQEAEISYNVQQDNTIQEPRQFACTGDTIRIANLEITTTGFYEVEDEQTCTTTVYEYEFQNCEDFCQPAFPEAFAPNGNGRNEVFRFNTPQVGDCVIIPQSLQIFNRWGELIHEGIDSWDGSNADQGVYIYQFTFSSTSRYGNQEDVSVVGNVTLVR